MEVLILSKTKYGNSQYCIGGIVTSTHQFIRLLDPDGYYQPIDTKLEVGDIWDITFRVSNTRREPHNEDVIVISKTFVKKIYALNTYIKNVGVKIWRGSVTNIYDGYIKWTNSGSGFVSENQPIMPEHSVGFWIPNEDLTYNNGYYEIGYKKLKYKGVEAPRSTIQAGSLIRVSLAKWWCPEDFHEKRCYLQLSGWYVDKPKPVTSTPQRSYSLNQNYSSNRVTSNYSTSQSSINRPSTACTYNYSQPKKNTSGDCYIATLCYQDYFADEVCSFRDFRDNTLSKHKIGKAFISGYYKYAPKAVHVMKNMPLLNSLIKHIILNPLLNLIKKSGWDK